MIKIVRSPRVFSRIEQLGVEESGEGVPSPQKKFFLIFCMETVYFGALYTLFLSKLLTMAGIQVRPLNLVVFYFETLK